MSKIVIYTVAGCPFCSKAKSFLEEKGVKYREITVSPNTADWEEMVRKTGSTSVPQIVISGEVVGGYNDLINLDAEGLLDEKLGLKREKPALPLYDLIIIGAGPAGLSAAIYAARKVLKTLIISKNIGGQVADTYDIENYLGFSQIETANLISKFNEHMEKYSIEKILGEEVVGLEIKKKIKTVITKSGQRFSARALIIATGKRPRLLNVPGERELIGRGVAYCATCDAPLFAGADVAVIGSGNSALEAARDLDKVANRVYVVSRRPWIADSIISDKVKASPKVTSFIGYDTVEIKGETGVDGILIRSLETGQAKELKVDGVFIEIGLLPNSDLALDLLETNQRGEIIIDCNCQTGVIGVFACGDVTSIPYKQVVIAAGEGAKAALGAHEYLMKQR